MNLDTILHTLFTIAGFNPNADEEQIQQLKDQVSELRSTSLEAIETILGGTPGELFNKLSMFSAKTPDYIMRLSLEKVLI